MTTDNKIRLAFAEDLELIRIGIVNTLTDFDFIIQASNGLEMLRKLRSAATMPHICIIDLSMPVMDGFELIKILRSEFPGIRTLVLSSYSNELNIMRILQLGANGYAKKNCSFTELIKAINSIYNQGYYYADVASERIGRLVNRRHTKSIEFTSKEMEVINYFCTEMTQDAIAKEMGITLRSLDGIRDRLYSKLDVNNRVGLIMLAVNSGLVAHDKIPPDSLLT